MSDESPHSEQAFLHEHKSVRLARSQMRKEKIMQESHEQNMGERRQRQIIGGWVAWTAFVLPLFMLVALWAFFLYSPKNENTTLLSVMFSATHISVVFLYFALIRGMFQSDKKDGETPAKQIVSLLEDKP